MKQEEHKIEQVFKNAFDDFNPEVSPNVWSRISEQLAVPASPSLQPSQVVVKTVSTKLTATASWIIGGITAVAITAGILLYDQREITNKKEIESVKVQSNQDITKDKAKQTINPLITEIRTFNKDQDVIIKTQQVESIEMASVDKSANAINAPSSLETSISNAGDRNLTSQPVTSANPVVKKADANKEATIDQETHHKPTKNVENATVSLLMLVNSTVGFAPMQVAGMLNRENLNGDWDFGDGGQQLKSNAITHKYLKPGTYSLQCQTSETIVSKTIEVIGQITSVFTPNGDGINDYFSVEAANLVSMNIILFDRNGRKTTELNNVTERWDGLLPNGGLAPTGTYFYELFATTNLGKEIKQRGTISLFR